MADDVASIASASVQMKQVQLKSQVDVNVLKKGLDMQKEAMSSILEMLGVGQNLDVQA